MQALAEALVPALGDWSAIYKKADGNLELVALRHVDSALAKNALADVGCFEMEERSGPWTAIRSRRTETQNELPDQFLARSEHEEAW